MCRPHYRVTTPSYWARSLQCVSAGQKGVPCNQSGLLAVSCFSCYHPACQYPVPVAPCVSGLPAVCLHGCPLHLCLRVSSVFFLLLLLELLFLDLRAPLCLLTQARAQLVKEAGLAGEACELLQILYFFQTLYFPRVLLGREESESTDTNALRTPTPSGM